MAKNLKLNVKNTQLAEALKKLQRPASKSVKADDRPIKTEDQEVPAKLVSPSQKKDEIAAPSKPETIDIPNEQAKEIEAVPVQKKPLEPRAPSPLQKEPSTIPPARPVAPPSSPPFTPKTYPNRPAPNYHSGSQNRQPSSSSFTPRRDFPQRNSTMPYRSNNYTTPPKRDLRPTGPRPPYSQGGGSHSHYQARPPGSRPPFRPGASGPGIRPNYPPRPGGPRPPYSGAPRPPRPPGAGGYRPFPSSFTRPPEDRKHPRVDDAARKKATGFKDFKDIKAQRKPETFRDFDSRDKQGLRDQDDSTIWRRRKRSAKGTFSDIEEIIRPKSLKVRIPITIKDLAAEMKLKASQLISSLFMKGVVLTLNDYLDDETTIQLIGQDFDCEISIDTSEEQRLQVTDKTVKEEIQMSQSEELVLRPPVATFMGHVDHGKTSLIDAIRKSNIAQGEAGEITQHIGAFRCHTAVGDITILDTPGHEAFSAMRARGANVTDIVVLVIAGDEGMRTQTIEALQQATDAKVPIMVALNKSDKPNFNAENVYRQLSEHNLLPEAWGGQTITVNCSALTGEGIPALLEMLALQAEVLEIKANPSSRARGIVIESEMHKGMGAVATVLVQNGTLHLGDAVVFDECWGRVKTMHDEHGMEVKTAGPSTPVKITGLSDLPGAGSQFIVVSSEKEAREVSAGRHSQSKHVALQKKKSGLENLLQQQAEKQEKKHLPLILRADVQGSLEALKHSLEKIISTKVGINIVSSEVGEISESDIALASASKATIIGFHTAVESHAAPLIKQLKVTVKLHDIIYHAVDDVKELMLGLLDKIAQENDIGTAEVKAIFKSSHLGNIAGCQTIDGMIRRNSHIRVVRDKEIIWKGPIASLKRLKEDVREVSKGQECGILLQGFNDCKEGDQLQAYDISYLSQEL